MRLMQFFQPVGKSQGSSVHFTTHRTAVPVDGLDLKSQTSVLETMNQQGTAWHMSLMPEQHSDRVTEVTVTPMVRTHTSRAPGASGNGGDGPPEGKV